jgi:hypothetical protein
MAPIELPQESSHPSHWTIDLYSTSLSVRFVSDQEYTVDSRPPLVCSSQEALRRG